MGPRVLHVVESFAPEPGSIAISLRGLFPALQRHGISSELLATNLSETPCGIERTHPFTPRMDTEIFDRPDLVHLHGWNLSIASRAAAAARKTGTPVIVSPLGALSTPKVLRTGLRTRLRQRFRENPLLHQAAALAAINERENHDLQAGGLSTNVVTLPYGLTFSEYAERPRATNGASEDRCLLVLAPVEPAQGCVLLLKAFAAVGRGAEDWSIVFAGPDRDNRRQMLQAAVRRKGGGNYVRFVDAIDVAKQRRALARASTLAAPGLHIQPPVSIMQALASGKIVVASDRLAPDGLNDHMYRCAPEIIDWTNTLAALFDLGDETRRTNAARARNAAAARFDWSVLSNEYAKLYRALI